MDRNRITQRALISFGFIKQINVFRGKDMWVWGLYTTDNIIEGGKSYDPILEWDEETEEMIVVPANYRKKINTIQGFVKMMDLASFLISTER